jgi:hypothetical protein
MEKFNYYKRGVGELNSSNFSKIWKQGHLNIETLDAKTFMSLSALSQWGLENRPHTKIGVTVAGYVEHLRGDKDLYPLGKLYNNLTNLGIMCNQIQHDTSIANLHYPTISEDEIIDQLPSVYEIPILIGADSSVKNFLPCVTLQAEKIRKNGKVTSLKFDTKLIGSSANIVIVDDILGGGATIQMLYNAIRAGGYTNDIHLWVQYNEGIHPDDFLVQFKSTYIGQKI